MSAEDQPPKTGKPSQGTKSGFEESFDNRQKKKSRKRRRVKRQKGGSQKYEKMGKRMETALKKTFHENPTESIAITHRWLRSEFPDMGPPTYECRNGAWNHEEISREIWPHVTGSKEGIRFIAWISFYCIRSPVVVRIEE
ncbi:hypothetical protein OIDMADRAFT_17139 [Oidiodendron maius Zn]|uniref:Uncharacterized protein n=1 Tax=Oidiodendron maius (strain Zn) TaxID=913774 RepID=A0A0C3HV05_OIDMZ|nr:hypothetical protein OIDMADRAFT_17139 [Oidiodendron maius Zn]